MKKIGFLGEAEAVTFNGEVALAPLTGFVTVSGKSLDAGGGTWAGGAGNGLVCGDHVIGTGGTEGLLGGWEGGVGPTFVAPEHPVSRPHTARIASRATSETRSEMRWLEVKQATVMRIPGPPPDSWNCCRDSSYLSGQAWSLQSKILAKQMSSPLIHDSGRLRQYGDHRKGPPFLTLNESPEKNSY